MSRSPKKIAKDLARQKSNPTFDERMALLRRSTGIKEEHVQEYQKTEIIRNAIQGVRSHAAVNEVARTSPKKLYSGVRSKVAGNVKSIKKSQKREQLTTTIN